MMCSTSLHDVTCKGLSLEMHRLVSFIRLNCATNLKSFNESEKQGHFIPQHF